LIINCKYTSFQRKIKIPQNNTSPSFPVAIFALPSGSLLSHNSSKQPNRKTEKHRRMALLFHGQKPWSPQRTQRPKPKKLMATDRIGTKFSKSEQKISNQNTLIFQNKTKLFKIGTETF
jgi:hypothetical protein